MRWWPDPVRVIPHPHPWGDTWICSWLVRSHCMHVSVWWHTTCVLCIRPVAGIGCHASWSMDWNGDRNIPCESLVLQGQVVRLVGARSGGAEFWRLVRERRPGRDQRHLLHLSRVRLGVLPASLDGMDGWMNGSTAIPPWVG